MNKNPQTRPIRGERIMNVTTSSTVDHLIAASPAADIPAPDIPPISAWEEDVGRPKYQVIMFHTIAPIRALRIIYGMSSVWTKSSLMILLIVLATATPNPNSAFAHI
jgi:hypothetical protein